MLAARIREVLRGRPGPGRDVVLLNAAAGLYLTEKVGTLRQGVQLAAESIDSGAAGSALDKLIEISNA